MTTMKDIAKKAGVSITTVSAVIHKTRPVSEQITQRVLAVMKEYDYQPSTLASGLKKGYTNLIGLVITDIVHPFYTLLTRSIEDTANSYSHSIILCNSDENIEKERYYVQVLRQLQIAGIIVVPTYAYDYSHLEGLIKHNIPLVLIDRTAGKMPVDVVLSDNVQGGYKATEYLISLGHTRIGVVSFSDKIISGSERIQGYIEALKKYGLSIDKNLIRIAEGYSEEDGYNNALKLLKSKNKPTALFATSSLITLGTLMAIKDLGLSIPEDISLLGYDDVAWAKIGVPLTVIDQHNYQIGVVATKLLFKRKRGLASNNPKMIRISPKLIERASCKKLLGRENSR
jgi:LacI family transcriptional regulator